MFGPAFSENDVCDMFPDSRSLASQQRNGRIWLAGDLGLVVASPKIRAPMYPYVALDTTKIHTLITLGISIRTKPLVSKARQRHPCGFDSHRSLHFSLSGVSLRYPRTRLSLSPSSQSLHAASTIPLIECVDRPLGRVRS
jgi:hypothetical protein